MFEINRLKNKQIPRWLKKKQRCNKSHFVSLLIPFETGCGPHKAHLRMSCHLALVYVEINEMPRVSTKQRCVNLARRYPTRDD